MLGRLGRRAAPAAPQSTAAANQTPDASAEPARGCGGPRAGAAKTPSIPPRPAAAAPAVPACGRPGVGGRKALRANEGDGRHEFQSHRRRTETARTKRTAEMSARRIAGAETLSEICLDSRSTKLGDNALARCSRLMFSWNLRFSQRRSFEACYD